MVMKKLGDNPIPPDQYPEFQPYSGPFPLMPAYWSAVVLLHPFSPPQSNWPNEGPWFQLCVANILYNSDSQDGFFSIQIQPVDPSDTRTWWYDVSPDGRNWLSTDKGGTWNQVDMGWSFPTNWFGTQAPYARCAGTSPLNWMATQPMDWWVAPVPNTSPPAATWMWFAHNNGNDVGAPVRMMFGVGPVASPFYGDRAQLAFFQMFSFTYVPQFKPLADAPSFPTWSTPSVAGLLPGNPRGYQNFVWNTNFGMTVFMTPVNEQFNPLPTGVLYVWKSDGDYKVYSDRAQRTMMGYDYNRKIGGPYEQDALLTGPSPIGPIPDSGTSFLITYSHAIRPGCTCVGPAQGFDFPQEPPNWVSIPGVEGTLQATVVNNPVIAPSTTVTIFSVLFPPSAPNYPDSTYLWTWYAPQDPTGVTSRPITFMQSQSGVGVGTSLALADYFYWEPYSTPIDPANFAIPSCCSSQAKKPRLRRRML